jgi:hypothetical protein
MAATEQRNVTISQRPDGRWWAAFETRLTVPAGQAWRPVDVPLQGAETVDEAAAMAMAATRCESVTRDTGETPVPPQSRPPKGGTPNKSTSK